MPKKPAKMTPEERREFIEQTMAETWAMTKESAALGVETRKLLNDYIRESQAYIRESRERVKRLEANLDAWLRGRGNGKP